MSFKRGEIYPTWLYHPTEPARVVHNATEDAALDDNWRETPYPVAETVSDGETADATPVEAPKKRGRKSKA